MGSRVGDFANRVFDLVSRIPRGKVSTYGQIARLMGRPQSGRYVGFALRSNPSPAADGGRIPCHRVVFKDGSLCPGFAFGGEDVQRELLQTEGVEFLDDGRVDMRASLWDPKGIAECDIPPRAIASNGDDAPNSPPPDFDWEAELGE